MKGRSRALTLGIAVILAVAIIGYAPSIIQPAAQLSASSQVIDPSGKILSTSAPVVIAGSVACVKASGGLVFYNATTGYSLNWAVTDTLSDSSPVANVVYSRVQAPIWIVAGGHVVKNQTFLTYAGQTVNKQVGQLFVGGKTLASLFSSGSIEIAAYTNAAITYFAANQQIGTNRYPTVKIASLSLSACSITTSTTSETSTSSSTTTSSTSSTSATQTAFNTTTLNPPISAPPPVQPNSPYLSPYHQISFSAPVPSDVSAWVNPCSLQSQRNGCVNGQNYVTYSFISIVNGQTAWVLAQSAAPSFTLTPIIDANRLNLSVTPPPTGWSKPSITYVSYPSASSNGFDLTGGFYWGGGATLAILAQYYNYQGSLVKETNIFQQQYQVPQPKITATAQPSGTVTALYTDDHNDALSGTLHILGLTNICNQFGCGTNYGSIVVSNGQGTGTIGLGSAGGSVSIIVYAGVVGAGGQPFTANDIVSNAVKLGQ